MAHKNLLYKNPKVDLKRKYPKLEEIGIIVALGLISILFYAFKDFKPAQRLENLPDLPPIVSEEIPRTEFHEKPPAPNNPIIPLPSEDPEIPDIFEIWNPGGKTEINIDPNPPFEEELVVPYHKLDSEPRIKTKVMPIYPQLARKAGITGTVNIEILINTNGEVEEPRVVKGHIMLIDAALEAIKQWEFYPGLQRNRPVKVRMIIPVQFNLK
jgi:protein TonB